MAPYKNIIIQETKKMDAINKMSASVFGTGEAKDKKTTPAAEGTGGIMQTTTERAMEFGESAKQTAIAGKDKTGEVLLGAGEQAKVMAQGATDAVKNAFAPAPAAADKKV